MKESTPANIALFLLRVVAGLLIFQPGAQKLFGWYGGMPAGATLTAQIQIGAILEVVGGILVLVGLGTRVAAFILSGMMAVAYFQFHQPSGTWPVQNGGAPAVLLCFIFLLFAAVGGGAWSLDSLIRRRRKEF